MPAITEIAAAIDDGIERLPYRPTTLAAEPGRYLVAESGVMAASVIGREDRRDGRWLYLDVGAYNGLMETQQSGGDWLFPISTSRRKGGSAAPLADFTVTGPSCDSSDTMFHHAQLPVDVAEGDRVYIGSAGVYTVSYASRFNGFAPPRTVFVR